MHKDKKAKLMQLVEAFDLVVMKAKSTESREPSKYIQELFNELTDFFNNYEIKVNSIEHLGITDLKSTLTNYFALLKRDLDKPYSVVFLKRLKKIKDYLQE